MTLECLNFLTIIMIYHTCYQTMTICTKLLLTIHDFSHNTEIHILLNYFCFDRNANKLKIERIMPLVFTNILFVLVPMILNQVYVDASYGLQCIQCDNDHRERFCRESIGTRKSLCLTNV